VTNTLAYYDTATITAVKSFIVQAPGARENGVKSEKICPRPSFPKKILFPSSQPNDF
jgi:hypothetical protein